MFRKTIFALALAVACQSPAAARNPAIKSGNDLLEACRSDGWSNGYCYGYILGIFRGLDFMSSATKRPLLCGAEDATVEQSRLIVLDYLRTHPKIMSQPSEYGVVAALMDAFSCE
jgi:hypothetical protein